MSDGAMHEIQKISRSSDVEEIRAFDYVEELKSLRPYPGPIAPQGWEALKFNRTQQIQQGPDETSEALHERLRDYV